MACIFAVWSDFAARSSFSAAFLSVLLLLFGRVSDRPPSIGMVFCRQKRFFTLCLGLRSRAAVALATVRAWICGCVVGLRLFLSYFVILAAGAVDAFAWFCHRV